jgi:glucosamine--fructose-6-phosphate aminotransferase (isomerizing)
MCGIFGMVSKTNRPVGQIILTGLKTLEYRGYDSWGIAVIQDKQISVQKEVGKIGNATLPFSGDSMIGIGHTRWATHGGVIKENAHPHLSYDGRFVVVHNGIVENYLELKEALIADGISAKQFISQTDSEVIAHLMAKEAEKNEVFPTFLKVMQRLRGLNAVVMMDTQTKELLVYKNGSPLVIGFSNEGTYFASDAVALIPHTKEVYYLEENEVFYNGKLFDLSTGKQKAYTTQHLDMEAEEITKGGYDHFMLKEIHEEPQIIRTVLDTFAEQKKEVLPLLEKYNDYCLIGCGTAFYVALCGQYLFAEQRIPALAYSGSESSHFLANLGPSTLPIFLSQSGETIDLIEQVNALQARDKEVLAIVNRVSSTLDRKAAVSYHLHAGPEISVVSTKAFIAKVTTLILITGALKGGSVETEYKKQLEKAVEATKKLFSMDYLKMLRSIAKELVGHQSVFTLGRGKAYPIALETALKSKEAAYVHNEGFAGGELKHGVISLIEDGTPCIVLVSGDSEDASIISNAIEVKSRGGKIFGISSTSHEVFDAWAPFENCGVANILIQTIIIQLLAYYMALEKGLDPDKPRNLAKSVTVK